MVCLATMAVIVAAAEVVPPGQPPIWTFLPPIAAFLVLGFFLIVLPQRRERQKHQDLITGLKKNDRVETIGGILGTVANVSPDGKEVTIKVDDSTRIRFLARAIARVEPVGGTSGEGTKSDTPAK